jgi:hypothetical protein
MKYTNWYAIVHRSPLSETPVIWGAGLRDAHLRYVAAGELAAVVSDWPQANIQRTNDTVDPDLVWQHERVIERIMGGRPVLPVRFGTILAGDARVEAVLLERQGVMKADLLHVAGCVELGVRVLWEPPLLEVEPALALPAGGAQTPGVRYLQQRAAAEQVRRGVQAQGQALAEELGRSLRTKAVDMRQTVLQTERMLLNAAFLVPKDETAAFWAAVAQLRTNYGQLAFLCSGPWPPYHFVSA